MENTQLEYSFLRAEKNADIVIFVKVQKQWLDKEIEIGLIDEQLVVELPDGEKYKSNKLEKILLERIENQITPLIFSDNEGNYLAEMDLITPKKVIKK